MTTKQKSIHNHGVADIQTRSTTVAKDAKPKCPAMSAEVYQEKTLTSRHLPCSSDL
jgi:hypothetical protein